MDILLIAMLSASNPIPPPPPLPIRKEKLVGLAGRMIKPETDEDENDSSTFIPEFIPLSAAENGTLCRSKSRTVRKAVSGTKKRPNRRGNRNW